MKRREGSTLTQPRLSSQQLLCAGDADVFHGPHHRQWLLVGAILDLVVFAIVMVGNHAKLTSRQIFVDWRSGVELSGRWLLRLRGRGEGAQPLKVVNWKGKKSKREM
jgi:hypothetical protein